MDVFLEKTENGTFFVAESHGKIVGVMDIQFRHIASPAHVTRDILFVDSMAVEENYRGQGIGHCLLIS